MDESRLSERQLRERAYYEEFSRRQKIGEISFDAVSGRETRPWNSYWAVYEFVLHNLEHSGQRLLDFGCGTGDAAIKFAKIGYEAWGFDISPNDIAIAESLASKYHLKNRTHFSVQIAEDLDYPSGFFDVVCGIDILHHLNIRQAMSECFRVLKKSGTAIFREPVEAPIFDRIRNTRLGLWLAPKGESFEHHITQDERKLTKESILTIKSIFPRFSSRRYVLLSHMSRLTGNLPLLERVDHLLLGCFPFLRRFGGEVVLVLKK